MRFNDNGVVMDRNGYVPSIIPGHNEYCCWNCKQNGVGHGGLDRHECIHSDMGGTLRARCKMAGLWVYLCHDTCHQGPNGVHANAELDERLKQEAERCALEEYGWTTQQFIGLFGKNYLEDDDGS